MNEDAPQEQETEALQEILRSLPLETCEYKTDPVTEIPGWYAPKGRIFRITGRFNTHYLTTPTDMAVYVPIPSVEEFIAEEKESYDRCLMEANYDKEKAFHLLYERKERDYFPMHKGLPISFEGKWIHIDIEESMSLTVRENIDAWVDDQITCTINNLTPGSAKINPLQFSVSGIPDYEHKEWRQQFAIATLGFCKIELVEYKEPPIVVVKPEKKTDNTTIYLPEPVLNHSSIFAYIEKTKGRKFSNAEKLEYMDYMQRQDQPFLDDPMDVIKLPDKNILRVPNKSTPLKVLLPREPTVRDLTKEDMDKLLAQQPEKTGFSFAKLKSLVHNLLQQLLNQETE